MDNTTLDLIVSEDKALLYNLGVQLGASEENAKKLTEAAQRIRLTVIVNPETAEIHVIGVNGIPTGKAVKI